MGEYLALLDFIANASVLTYPIGLTVNVYPNPTNGLTNLVFNLSENDQIQVSLANVNGQQVVLIDAGQKNKGTYSYQIDLSPYPKGIYFLTLATTKGTFTQKIVFTE